MADQRRRVPGNPSDRVREQRRAAALRANMKRRKAQARARAQNVASATPHDSAGIVPEIAPDKPKG